MLIATGRATASARCNGQLLSIRMRGAVAVRRETAHGYDVVDRSFYEEARALPMIAPERLMHASKKESDAARSRRCSI
jgi:hypothetical protein